MGSPFSQALENLQVLQNAIASHLAYNVKGKIYLQGKTALKAYLIKLTAFHTDLLA